MPWAGISTVNCGAGDGTLRRLSLDVGQVNAAFAALGDDRATARALTEAPETTFIEMQVALVSHPAIAKAILGEGEAANLLNTLQPGEHAIAVMGRGIVHTGTAAVTPANDRSGFAGSPMRVGVQGGMLCPSKGQPHRGPRS